MARNTISRAQLYLITLTLCVCVIVLSLSDTNIQREVATDLILAPLTTESHVWAHAFFRQLPSLCILKAELQAP